MILSRRSIALGLAASPFVVRPLKAAGPTLAFATAGRGSAFLPYGQGIAKIIEAAGAATIQMRETGGSNDNLRMVQAEPATIGTVFLGSAFAAINGIGFANGVKHDAIRALFPMYETSFQVAALARSNLTRIADLASKKVGCGPARGPAEDFFRVLAEVAGISPTIVSGAPADLARALAAGEIDALWQGAVVPIPALVQAGTLAETVVFGLTEQEVAGMRARLPFMAEAAIAPNTYKGQPAALRSVAAWNFVLANAGMADDTAHAITRAVLTSADVVGAVGPAGRGTRAENAATNRVVPFHPGAARFYREAGIALG